MTIHCGDERRLCRAGDLIIVFPEAPHGFQVGTGTGLDVVAEYEFGTRHPVSSGAGPVDLRLDHDV